MTDIVNRLKTFVAPENWDADQLIFDATKEIERLRSAKSDSSQLDIEVESLKARVKQLEAALRPFAECARVFDPDMHGGTMPKTGPWQSWPRMVDDKLHMYELTVEHLREARAILEDRT